MSKVTLTVNPGVCGFKTVIVSECEDMMNANFTIESECPAVAALAEELTSLDVMNGLMTPFATNPVYEAAGVLPHGTCPVPCAILKAAEASADFALKRDISMEFSK
ncbi:MAG: hypothetical protein GX224_06965 [Thermoplasmatales archaeon]|nr:hypothetical protein [Thermoplasmatales archaeon]